MNCDELFEFERCGDEYLLTKFLRKHDSSVTEIEIPSEYNGLPVFTVENTAFRKAPYIKSVFIPDCCTVSAGAFRSCHSLQRARIGGIAVLKEAFSGCNSLETVTFAESIRLIEYAAFMRCKKLEHIVLPDNLECIREMAFLYCEGLKSMTFPDKEVIVGAMAFSESKLPAEVMLYSLTGVNDIAKPISDVTFQREWNTLFRGDVFALAIKSGCLRELDRDKLFGEMTKYDLAALLPLAEELLTTEITDGLIRHCSETRKTEALAWLLDCKNRKFGFNGGNDLEL